MSNPTGMEVKGLCKLGGPETEVSGHCEQRYSRGKHGDLGAAGVGHPGPCHQVVVTRRNTAALEAMRGEDREVGGNGKGGADTGASWSVQKLGVLCPCPACQMQVTRHNQVTHRASAACDKVPQDRPPRSAGTCPPGINFTS